MYGNPFMDVDDKMNKILFHSLVTSIDTRWNFVFQQNCHGTESVISNILNQFLVLVWKRALKTRDFHSCQGENKDLVLNLPAVLFLQSVSLSHHLRSWSKVFQIWDGISVLRKPLSIVSHLSMRVTHCSVGHQVLCLALKFFTSLGNVKN